MNQVVLIGRLTRDPELRFIPSTGTAVGRFGIAVNRDFKKEGQPDADFFNVVTWGKQAENCANYLKKGRLVAIHGQLRNNNYEDQNGVKHYNIEVVASKVMFLEWGDSDRSSGYERQEKQSNKQQKHDQDNQQKNNNPGLYDFQAIDGDDDIPF